MKRRNNMKQGGVPCRAEIFQIWNKSNKINKSNKNLLLFLSDFVAFVWNPAREFQQQLSLIKHCLMQQKLVLNCLWKQRKPAMCSCPNSTRARIILTITRQVFWLIPIARLGAFPPKNWQWPKIQSNQWVRQATCNGENTAAGSAQDSHLCSLFSHHWSGSS